MLDIATLEGRLADAWPALVDEPLGSWRLRAAGGFTGRANSALTCGDPGLPLGEALSRVVDFAQQHGIAPTAHVVRGDPVEDGFAAHGWVVDVDHPGGAEPLVLVAPLDGACPPDAVTIATRPSTSWWRLCADTDPPDAAQRHVLGTGERVGFGDYVVDGELVGAVRGAVVADTLHVARLAVSPDHRRGGAGSALMGVSARGARPMARRTARCRSRRTTPPRSRSTTRSGSPSTTDTATGSRARRGRIGHREGSCARGRCRRCPLPARRQGRPRHARHRPRRERPRRHRAGQHRGRHLAARPANLP